MQRVDLEISAFTRRAGSVLVSHTATGLDRGLEPGERLLVRDRDGSHLMATVRDISFDLTDTLYRLELGAAVDADETALLLSEAPLTEEAAAAGAVDLTDVLALLQGARGLGAERAYRTGGQRR